MNREEWLTKGIEKLTPMFNAIDVTIPQNVRVSCGFCKGKKAIGLCCPEIKSEGNFIEIFIDPQIAESTRALDVLAHELIHASLLSDSKRHGHGGKFKQIAEKIGLLPPMQATTASPFLKEKLEAIVKEIGEYPHKAVHDIHLGRRKIIKSASKINTAKKPSLFVRYAGKQCVSRKKARSQTSSILKTFADRREHEKRALASIKNRRQLHEVRRQRSGDHLRS